MMETVRVNMTPNNEVKTIHCSQNDGNTRKWGFELYKEDGVIDGSSIKEQMLFNAYKGGTEQILPENTSTPTTSPIIADIQYKDALRSEQEFLYRESPATEDGQARITKIKGNTVKFNQLIQNGNFANTDGWARAYSGVISATDNVLTYTNNSGQTLSNWQTEVKTPTFSIPANHKIYCRFDIHPNNHVGMNSHIAIANGGNKSAVFSPSTVPQNVWTTMKLYSSFDSVLTNFNIRMIGESAGNGSTSNMRRFICIDVTSIFDSGNEPPTVSDFETWLSSHIGNLPYYDYTLGTLIPFTANSLKTVNADETEESTLSLPISTYFPTGMKRAGNIFDELTENKTYTRVGSVDMGTLEWSRNATYNVMYAYITDKAIGRLNIINPKYEVVNKGYTTMSSGEIAGTTLDNGINCKDDNYTDATTFKNAMSGVYLFYELETPTETEITTASLVTEKGEIPLYYDDSILKANCLTALSSEAGIFDAKIKLMDDEIVYSQKIQLHVERKP